jgi:hypothetical protein
MTLSSRQWPGTHVAIFRQFDAIERAANVTLDAIDPSVTYAVRSAAATNLGHAAELTMLMLHPHRKEKGADARAEIAYRFTEQFVIDVTGVDEELRTAIGKAFGAATFSFVQSVYVIDVFQRARIAFGRLFDGEREVATDATTDGDLWTGIEAFMRSVALLDAVDPVVTELVRLCGARVHNCRLCQSRLSAAAVEAAGTEELFREVAVARLGDVRQQTAVELASELVTQPSSLSADLVDRAHRQFTDAELIEIVLDVVRNAANKIAVAFGADTPVVDVGVEYFAIDASGDVVANTDIGALRTM